MHVAWSHFIYIYENYLHLTVFLYIYEHYLHFNIILEINICANSNTTSGQYHPPPQQYYTVSITVDQLTNQSLRFTETDQHFANTRG